MGVCNVCGNRCLGELCWKHKPAKKIKTNKSGMSRITQEQMADMWVIFREIWAERPHFCEETGRSLGSEPNSTMFHHLLHKAPYPQFQFEKGNIMLLHPDVHQLAHQNIDATPEVKRRTEEARDRYL